MLWEKQKIKCRKKNLEKCTTKIITERVLIKVHRQNFKGVILRKQFLGLFKHIPLLCLKWPLSASNVCVSYGGRVCVFLEIAVEDKNRWYKTAYTTKTPKVRSASYTQSHPSSRHHPNSAKLKNWIDISGETAHRCLLWMSTFGWITHENRIKMMLISEIYEFVNCSNQWYLVNMIAQVAASW